MFKYSVHTAKKAPHLTIRKVNLLTSFKDIIAVFTENHTDPISTKAVSLIVDVCGTNRYRWLLKIYPFEEFTPFI
jgi:hypothetical protein